MREHGVEVRAPDVNHSDRDTTLVPDGQGGVAVRLGLRTIGGFPQAAAARLLLARDEPFRDIPDLQRRAGLSSAWIRRLAEADAMRSLFIDRRQALWETGGLRDAPDLPLFQGTPDEGPEPTVPLPPMPLPEQVVADYQTLRLSLKAHPMAFLRRSLRQQGYIAASDLATTRNYQPVRLAGLVLVRQRPGSAKGVCFITLEDETGSANLVVWPKVMESFRKVVMQARLLVIEGHVQREVEIVHVVAARHLDRTDALLRLAPEGFAPALSHADEVARPVQGSARSPQPGHPRDARIIPKSRDFH
jgi:error-prone DNA polymerase